MLAHIEQLQEATTGNRLAVLQERDALRAKVSELEAENERLNDLIRKVSKGGIPERQRTFEGVCNYLYVNHEK